MVYYRNPADQLVYGYDPATQQDLIDQAINNGWISVSNWPLPPNDEQLIEQCKQQAISLLSQTDWSVNQDVVNPAITPHLLNQVEFVAYRSVIRNLAVNPIPNPEWPIPPTAQWSS